MKQLWWLMVLLGSMQAMLIAQTTPGSGYADDWQKALTRSASVESTALARPTAERYTAQQLWGLLQAHDYELQSAAVQRNLLSAQERGAWLDLLPKLTVASSVSGTFAAIDNGLSASAKAAQQAKNDGEFGLSGTLSFSFNPFNLPAGLERSKARLLLDQAKTAKSKELQLYTLCYQLRLSAKKLKLRQQVLEQVARNLVRVQANVKSGFSDALALVEAETHVYMETIELEKEQLNSRGIQQSIVALTGLPAGSSIELQEQDDPELALPLLPAASVVPAAIVRSWMAREDQQEVYDKKILAILPQAKLGLNGSWPLMTSNQRSTLYGEPRLDWSLQLALDLTGLLPDSAAWREIEKQQVLLQQRQAEYQILLSVLPSQLVLKRKTLDQSGRQLELAIKNQTLAALEYKAAQAGFSNGQISASDVYQALIDDQQARFAVWEAQNRQWLAAWDVVLSVY